MTKPCPACGEQNEPDENGQYFCTCGENYMGSKVQADSLDTAPFTVDLSEGDDPWTPETKVDTQHANENMISTNMKLTANSTRIAYQDDGNTKSPKEIIKMFNDVAIWLHDAPPDETMKVAQAFKRDPKLSKAIAILRT
jgi:hypothetical protein